ncbi:hypothetical protein EJ07DRAFT_180588 [Lizonia empirigonia]|nr:hypothetical protein EJ07DRAFT_180588 [Lizonia empirigonia]
MSYRGPFDDDRTQHQQPGPGLTQPSKLNYSSQNVRNALRKVVEGQTRLAKSREDLVIERDRLRTFSSRVRNKRIQAGDAEAALMSTLRGFTNEAHKEVSSLLTETYTKVETLRDELGELEEEFLQAERSLAGSEWRFMDDENDFYQIDLLDIFDKALSGSDLDFDELKGQRANRLPMSIQGQLLPNPLPLPSTSPPPSPPPPPPPSFMYTSYHDNHLHQHLPLPPPPPPPPPPTLGLNLPTRDTLPIPHMQASSIPRLMLQPPASELLATQTPEDRDYRIVTAELGTLRQRFESLRQARAEQLHTVEDDCVFGDILPETLEWSVSDEQATVGVEEESYFSMLEQISNREVEAQRLEYETMFREIQRSVIARRGSDPTHLANAAPTPSIFMGKAFTETALPMLSNEPKVKSRLPAWLLARLKEDPLQRTMYRNILVHRGLQSPVGESWEDRAAHYWDTDNASNYEPEYKDIDGDEDADEDDDFDGEDGGSSQTRATSHEPSLESSSMSRIKLEGVRTSTSNGFYIIT